MKGSMSMDKEQSSDEVRRGKEFQDMMTELAGGEFMSLENLPSSRESIEDIRSVITMRPATEVFSEWAESGLDAGMESVHAPAVTEILTAAFEEMNPSIWGRGFHAIDAGCGNGWVVRLLSARDNCKAATGVDGAELMIGRARDIDPSGTYIHSDLHTWFPEEPVDLVHSMEVLYYLDDIPDFLESVHSRWLRKDGLFAFGVDHYHENEESHGWSEKVGVRMAMHSELEWCKMVEEAGFEILRMFRATPSDAWPGTLSIIARRIQ